MCSSDLALGLGQRHVGARKGEVRGLGRGAAPPLARLGKAGPRVGRDGKLLLLLRAPRARVARRSLRVAVRRRAPLRLGRGRRGAAAPLPVAARPGGDAPMVRQPPAARASADLLGQAHPGHAPATPLSRACALGSVNIATELLRHPEARATLNVAGDASPRRTPLIDATHRLRASCVRLLLAEPALDASLAGEHGSTALHAAVSWGKSRAAHWQGAQRTATAIVTLLVEHVRARGQPIDAVDNDGCTPLCHAAAAAGDQAQWVRQLLDAGASPRVHPHGGDCALGWRHARAAAAASTLPAVASPNASPSASPGTSAADQEPPPPPALWAQRSAEWGRFGRE